jgi:hypothetical protein
MQKCNFTCCFVVVKPCSLALREERILKMSENIVMKTVPGYDAEEATRGWRKLRNEEMHDLY